MVTIPVISLVFALVSLAGSSENKLTTEPTVWKIHLQPPIVSGFHRNFRDVRRQEPQVQSIEDFEFPVAGLGLSWQWGGRWMVDGNINLVFDAPVLRVQTGLQVGPTWDILNHRDERGEGAQLSFVQLFGTSYRTRGTDIMHGSGSGLGQNTLATTWKSMLDFTYFVGRGGLNARVWMDGGYAIFRWGDPVWNDSENVDQADNYRAYMGVGIDLGVAF